MADHRTPLIRRAWYVAARSDELGRSLLERTLLNTTVVMFRRLDGSPAILNNRCVHRSFPLSKSQLVGDTVVCGYHGMVYAPDGQGLSMPSLPNCPRHAKVQVYPVVERAPLVWVWMGEPEMADPRLIPETPWLSDPQWATVQGHIRIQSNYVAMHENLLDQTHFGVLHAGAVGTPEYARSTLTVQSDAQRVWIARALLNSPPPGIYDHPMKLNGKRVDRYSDSRFESPAAHIAHARIVDATPAPGRPQTFHVNIAHLFTPERQNSIHYWWFNSRDFDVHDEQASAFLHAQSQTAYAQDEAALNWIQRIYDESSEPAYELSFAPDRPGLLMRKILLDLAQSETPPQKETPC